MKTLPLILTCVMASTLANCAVGTAGVKKGDERNLSRSVNDVSAKRVIVARLKRAEGHRLSSVNVDVAEGIVVLSGTVLTAEERLEAERVAWSAPNIVQVGNEIRLRDDQSFIGNSRDGLLQQNIRARLVADRAVKSRNYNLEIQDGTVYLLGVARSAAELERAARIASTTRGTREVISYVRIHGEEVPQSAEYPEYDYSTYSGALPSNLSRQPSNGAGPHPEPYYVDPQTGEVIDLPPGVTPIPYSPSLGSAPSRVSNLGNQVGKAFPSDNELGNYRAGQPGDPVSIIESEPYYIDPDTGKQIPVSHLQVR